MLYPIYLTPDDREIIAMALRAFAKQTRAGNPPEHFTHEVANRAEKMAEQVTNAEDVRVRIRHNPKG